MKFNKTTIALVFTMLLCPSLAMAERLSVGDIHAQRLDLAGQQVTVSGTVIKVNNNIMRRNFIHLQDGTGSADSDRVIVTSQQTAQVGDKVDITGKLTLDTDFTMGYFYPTLITDASVTPAE